MLGCLIAATKSTKRTGATNAVPGSHLWPHDRVPNMEEAVLAEMEVGSALFWLGGTYHGGGTNSCEVGEEGSLCRLYGVFGSPDCYGQELNLSIQGQMLLASLLTWLTPDPQENQYLALLGLHPHAIPKLSREVLRVAGFGRTKGGIGWIDWQDPVDVLLPHRKDEPKEAKPEAASTAALA